MWTDLRVEIEIELDQLHRLRMNFEEIQADMPLEPATRDILALGSLLHSFYNGVENALKRVVIAVDGEMPSGEGWHSELLRRATAAAAQRPRVIAPELHEALLPYLGFRHVFRHTYSFELQWSKMSGLVEDFPLIAEQIAKSLRSFLNEMDANSL